MRISRRIAAALIVLAPALGARAQEPTPAAQPRRISVTAKKFEFNPSRIELKTGEPVEITLQSEDATHGFICEELGIEKVVYEKGKPATVSLTPQKPGAYEFKCAKWCGLGHGKMKGEFVVTSAEPPKNSVRGGPATVDGVSLETLHLRSAAPCHRFLRSIDWTFHRELEQGHEDAMSRTLETVSPEKEASLREGCRKALDLLESFWLGLGAPAPPVQPMF